jgi:hypothetical protein
LTPTQQYATITDMSTNPEQQSVPLPAIPAIVKAAEIAAPIFVAKGWSYGWPSEIPDRDQLIATIAELVAMHEEDDDAVQVSSGRFTVLCDYEDDSYTYSIHLDLSTTESIAYADADEGD